MTQNLPAFVFYKLLVSFRIFICEVLDSKILRLEEISVNIPLTNVGVSKVCNFWLPLCDLNPTESSLTLFRASNKNPESTQ